MSNRNNLALRAAAVGIDPSTVVNDSVLEQQVITAEKNASAVTGTDWTGTLTASDVFSDGETITIGDRTYTMKTALTGVRASQTLTSDNTQVSDGDQVQVAGVTYTFRTTVSQPYDVHIVTDADTSLGNLVKAINASGSAGTDYGVGTVAHPRVTAGNVTSHATTITAIASGTAGNSLDIAENAAHLSVGGGNFSGGVNSVADEVLIGASAAASLDNIKDAVNKGAVAGSEGTTYGFGTKANKWVTAGTNTDTTQVVTARSKRFGSSIATTETCANAAWGGATLAGGAPNVVAPPAAAVQGVPGGQFV